MSLIRFIIGIGAKQWLIRNAEGPSTLEYLLSASLASWLTRKVSGFPGGCQAKAILPATPELASGSISARPSCPSRTAFSYPDRRLDFSECANSEEVIVQLSFDLDTSRLGAEDSHTPHRNI